MQNASRLYLCLHQVHDIDSEKRTISKADESV